MDSNLLEPSSCDQSYPRMICLKNGIILQKEVKVHSLSRTPSISNFSLFPTKALVPWTFVYALTVNIIWGGGTTPLNRRKIREKKRQMQSR